MRLFKYLSRYLDWLFDAPKSSFGLDTQPVIIRAIPMFLAIIVLFFAFISLLQWCHRS
jgi:ABC-type arginine transport system permease subunit